MIKVDIFFLISVTAVLSTVASIGGALLMHFESLAALEDTVEEVSQAELLMVTNQLKSSFLDVQEQTRKLMTTLLNTDLLKSDYSNGTITVNDTARWANLLKTYQYGVVRASDNIHTLLISLIPYEKFDPTFQFNVIMFDELANGKRAYSSGETGQHIPESMEIMKPAMVPTTLISTLDNVTGEEIHLRRKIPSPFWLFFSDMEYFENRTKTPTNATQAQLDFNDWDDSTPAPKGWRRHPPQPESPLAMLDSFRKPRAWYAPDKNPFVFLAYDRLYKPPPPPHPWSSYHVIWVSSSFAFNAWDKVLKDYSEKFHLTDVVVLNALTETVFASSTGATMLDDSCVDVMTSNLDECSSKISDMSIPIQKAWRSIGHIEGSVFRVVHSHFVRKMPVYEFLYKFKCDALWLRETSIINSKIESALWLMVAFILTVLVIDILLIIAERQLIAVPVSRLCTALASLKTLRIDESRRNIKGTLSNIVLVRQIEDLASSMSLVATELDAYKTFLPASVLIEEANPSDFEKDALPPGLTTEEATIVFTDIENSTDLWEGNPSSMGEALSIHNNLARKLISLYGGYEVKTLGDAFMISFTSPLNAIKFALSFQVDLMAAKWPEDILRVTYGGSIWNGLRIRIGIHHGEVRMEQNTVTGRWDYFGGTVNKSSRIQNRCPPGGILVSKESLELICYIPDNVTEVEIPVLDSPVTISLGDTSLKGFASPTSIFLLIPKVLKDRAVHLKPCMNPISTSVSVDSQSSIAKQKDGGSSPSNHLLVEVLRFVKSVTICKMSLYFSPMGILTSAADQEFEVHQQVSELHTRLMLDVERTNGTVLTNCGSSIVISWNALKVCQAHYENAVTFCSRVSLASVDCALGVCSGPASCGRVRGYYHKFQAVIGSCVHVASALAFDSEKLGIYIYTSLTSNKSLSYTSTMRPIDLWKTADGLKRNIVYQLYTEPFDEDDGNDSVGSGFSLQSAAPGWCESYWEMFFLGNSSGIDALSSDPILKLVAQQFRDSTHLDSYVILNRLPVGINYQGGGHDASRKYQKEIVDRNPGRLPDSKSKSDLCFSGIVQQG